MFPKLTQKFLLASLALFSLLSLPKLYAISSFLEMSLEDLMKINVITLAQQAQNRQDFGGTLYMNEKNNPQKESSSLPSTSQSSADRITALNSAWDMGTDGSCPQPRSDTDQPASVPYKGQE